ncbi:MAG: dihydroneopterin aldolase [Deltaproteobacteria bacterium]|nr:dihydroneopterin aldolase [Deltaproteobacteria bacterium]
MLTANHEYDIITCRGFQYACEIGIFENEQGVKQKILVDLKVPIKKDVSYEQDRVQDIQFAYDQANQVIKGVVEGKRYNLIESLAEKIACELLQKFAIEFVEVEVTKFPIDMPNADSVSFTCIRGR